jgi:hypothetical protein
MGSRHTDGWVFQEEGRAEMGRLDVDVVWTFSTIKATF